MYSRDQFAAAFDVSRETVNRLDIYANQLISWQKTINLVAPSTVGDVWGRHFADSAQVMALAPRGARRWVDLGSGGGFPGLVVAILLAERGGAHVSLLDSDSRKCAFLGEVVRRTGIANSVAVDIESGRIEKLATEPRFSHIDVVTARALAPLTKLLGLALPLYSPLTVGLFLKGREAASEVTAAEQHWSFACELRQSVTDSESRIAVVRHLAVKPER